MSQSKGDPRAAVEAFLISQGRTKELAQMRREGLKRKIFGGSAPIRIGNDAVQSDASRVARETPDKVEAPLLCFPLGAFAAGDPDLPADFALLERSGSALRAHVRPDGAVFLGLFELPQQPATAIVVFGPESTPSDVSVAVSQQYREEQHALESGRLAAHQNAEQSSHPQLVS